jgi:hypothetical protein
LLILIGVLQVSDAWDYLMSLIRGLIDGFIPVL